MLNTVRGLKYLELVMNCHSSRGLICPLALRIQLSRISRSCCISSVKPSCAMILSVVAFDIATSPSPLDRRPHPRGSQSSPSGQSFARCLRTYSSLGLWRPEPRSSPLPSASADRRVGPAPAGRAVGGSLAALLTTFNTSVSREARPRGLSADLAEARLHK